MYKIDIIDSSWLAPLTIYDDRSLDDGYTLINPKLTMEDNAAGSLTFKLPMTNYGYSEVKRLSSYVIVYRDESPIWAGRVLRDEEDFNKNRTIYCEGVLSFLNDVTQPPAVYHHISPRNFLNTLLENYEEKRSSGPHIMLGNVTVTDPNNELYRYTNYETTWECIKDKLVDRLGGHLMIRFDDTVQNLLYLDWLSDYQSGNSQIIEFGSNLLDYTKSYDMSELSTVIIPLGKMQDEQEIEGLDKYLDIKSVNNGKDYVKNDAAIAQYGWIEEVVHFDDVTVPANLKTKGTQYLNEHRFEEMVLEVNAIDLHNLNPEIQELKLLDTVRVVSVPHGLNRDFDITKIVLPLYDPSSAEYTLGKTEKAKSYVKKNTNSLIAIYENSRVTSGKVTKAQNTADYASTQAASAQSAVSTVFTELTQTNDQIVMKVNASTGAMALVKLGTAASDPSATEFKVKAGNLKLSASETISLMSGGTINLNAANGISISSPNFSVTRTGALTSTLGNIGGWAINATQIKKEITVTENNEQITYRPYLNAPASPTKTNVAFGLMRKDSSDNTTYPWYVRYDGYMRATLGSIANFTITTNMIYGDHIDSQDANKRSRSVMRAILDGEPETTLAFYIRTTENGSASSPTYAYPWYVRYDGSMSASKGTIGGWSIDSTSLYKTRTESGYTWTSTLNPDMLTMESKSNTDKFKVEIKGSSIAGYSALGSGASYGSADFIISPNQGRGTFYTLVANEISARNTATGPGELYIHGSKIRFGSHTQFEALVDFIGTIQAKEGIEIVHATPYIDFHLNSSTADYTARVVHRTDGYLDFIKSSSAWLGLKALSFNVQSSKYVKDNINDISNKEAMKLLQLRPVSFDYKFDGGKNKRGLIAEEVLEVMPEMVEVPEGYTEFDPENAWNTPSIDYSKFVPYIIKMIQIQQKEIDILKEAIK